MAKIMLVEDDNNLREIYGARLLAEGHDIVAAQDGEEALALAVKEKPDLIISDVMMPRISGFDMLDILRNAPETKETKVIMMTALSQAEDKARADKLGADRYLVKSQVTLEDVANVVREVLDEGNTAETPPADETAPVALPAPAPSPEPTPVPVVAAPVAPVAVQPVPTAVAVAPAPVTAPVEPGPTIPEIVTIEETNIPIPTGPSTLEQIANPVLEIADDTEPVAVQVPPVVTETPPADETAPVALPAPAPVVPPAPILTESPAPAPPIVTQPATPPTPIIQSTPSTSANQPLPPVVEPATPIKVVLPTPLDGTNEQDTTTVDSPAPIATQIPVTSDDATTTVDPQSGVGPSLLEALQAEENDDPNIHSAPAPTLEIKSDLPAATEAESPKPVIANGVAVSPVISPTQAAVSQPTSETEASVASTFESAIQDAGGVKRVIQPIGDGQGPDINALLAAEEQKAAVANPVANTVITPTPAAPEVATPTPIVPAPAKDDDVNNFAL